MRTKSKTAVEQDADSGRVFAVWRPGHFGKIIRQGPEVSEIKWEPGEPHDLYISNYYLFDESISPARARVLSRLARIRKGLP